jgi:hypothetical protein
MSFEGALADSADEEVQFKLRTAIQLVYFIEDQHDETDSVLTDAELDEETRTRLRELGYLD